MAVEGSRFAKSVHEDGGNTACVRYLYPKNGSRSDLSDSDLRASDETKPHKLLSHLFAHASSENG